MRLSEFKDDRTARIKHFIKWTMGMLEIPGDVPQIVFSEKKTEKDQHHTGRFQESNNTLYIYTHNRNTIDILRTVAHELTHYKQNLQGKLKRNQSFPGSPAEQEADSAAGYLVKIYGKKHPQILD